MECDACGRYMPSAKVLPVLDRDGDLRMVCLDCRPTDGPGRPVPSAVMPILAGPRRLQAIPAGH
jgi:hypothetical protein